jgi:hypothetical protein
MANGNDPDWHRTDWLRPLPGPAPMQQHAAYGAVCAALGTEVAHWELRRRDKPLATAQVLVRRWPLLGRFALLSRGPVWHPDLAEVARRAALVRLVAHLRTTHRGVMVTPDRIGDADPLAQVGMLAMVSAGHTARLPVRADEAAQLAQMHGKWRNRLRRAERGGLDLREAPMPPDSGHWLLRSEAAQAQARRYARLPAAFALAWAAGHETRLFSAWANGKPVAGMLFLRHGGSASYHVGWAAPEGRAAHAHSLLLWRAMLWAQGCGVTAMELGTLDTERTPDLARFKLGAGAAPVALGATRLAAIGTGLLSRLQGPNRTVRPDFRNTPDEGRTKDEDMLAKS